MTMPFRDNLKEAPKEAPKRAVIVSVAEFYPGVPLNNRKGANRDAKRLHKTLSRLGFSVAIHSDLTGDGIYKVFKAESEKTVSSCFVGVVSSHGEEGVVFGADGEPVRLAQVFSWFGGPSMAGKTKLFLIQACRGGELDSGVEVETDSAPSCEEGDGLSECFSIPINTAVMYATPPGYSAFMNLVGSVFIKTFCDLLEEDGGRDLEINRLMTRLNGKVAYDFQARGQKLAGKKEMPCFVTRLTKEAFPFRDSRKATGDLSLTMSAMALVDEPHRPRKHSIS